MKRERRGEGRRKGWEGVGGNEKRAEKRKEGRRRKRGGQDRREKEGNLKGWGKFGKRKGRHGGRGQDRDRGKKRMKEWEGV